MLVFGRSLHLSPDAPAATPPAAAPPATPPIPPERRVDQYLDRLLARHGTTESALRAISADLFTAQDSLVTLTAQLDQYKTRLPEGAVVLTKEAAGNWTKLQELKLSPDQIIQGLKERDDLKGKVSASELEKLARTAAAAANYDPDAVVALASTKGLHIEMRDTTVKDEKGKDVVKKLPHVRPAADEKAHLEPLSAYVGKLPPFEQRALAVTAAPPGTPATPTGTPYPESRPTPDHPTPTDPVAAFHQKVQGARDNRPNPLIPRPVAKVS